MSFHCMYIVTCSRLHCLHVYAACCEASIVISYIFVITFVLPYMSSLKMSLWYVCVCNVTSTLSPTALHH